MMERKRKGGVDVSLVGRRARNHPLQPVDRVVDDRATPIVLFARFDAEYQFTIDVAASPANAKLARFFTFEQDGLAQSWAGERVWCNPPYSSIKVWVLKAIAEVASGCPLVVMLLPANRTEQSWWQDFIEPHRDRGCGITTRFIRDRIKFYGAKSSADARKPGENRPPFGNVLVVFEPPRGR